MNYINNNQNKTGLSFLQTIIILISTFFVFIPPLDLIPLTYYSVITFLFVFLLFIIQFSKNSIIIFNNTSVSLFVFITFCCFSVLYSYDFQNSFKHCLILIICTMLFYCFSKNTNWLNFFEKLLLCIALINSFITILSSLNYDLFISLFGKIMSNSSLQFANTMKLFHAYSGIMGQTGTNATTIAPLIIISCCNIKNRKNRLLNILFLILGCWALVLTKKRGETLWPLISLFIVYFLNNKKRHIPTFLKTVKFSILLLSLFIFIYLLYFYIPEVESFISRFLPIEDHDISSNRFELYSHALHNILSHPFGVGINAYNSIFGDNVHNDFLQIAAEISIIGLISLIIFVFSIIKNAKNAYLKSNSKNDIHAEIFLALSFYLCFSCLTSFPIHHFGVCIQFFLFLAANQSLTKDYQRTKKNENRNRYI